MERHQQRLYAERLFKARMKLMKSHSFYALLLISLKFGLDEEIGTAGTNGEEILFAPSFLDRLTDSELAFILLHEVLHVALKHHSRGSKYDKELYNVAADIVINSTILKSGVSIKVDGRDSIHLTPDGREGHLFTTEEVYQMLLIQAQSNSSQNDEDDKTKKNKRKRTKGFNDNHDTWEQNNNNSSKLAEKRLELAIYNAIKLSQQLAERGFCAGNIPLEVERTITSMGKTTLDWRTILHDFIQLSVTDYTFNPPDRRFNEQDFFFPDLAPSEESVSDILFMIDTSGSVSEEELSSVFAEIKSAINQFDGWFSCEVGFFDTEVKSVDKIECIEDIKKLKPKGFGGTEFACIFEYIKNNMYDNLPKALVVLTDGYSWFPPEKDTLNLPILWILTGEYVNDDIPYGRVIKTD